MRVWPDIPVSPFSAWVRENTILSQSSFECQFIRSECRAIDCRSDNRSGLFQQVSLSVRCVLRDNEAVPKGLLRGAPQLCITVFHNMLDFLMCGCVSSSPNLRAREPPLVGCSQLPM